MVTEEFSFPTFNHKTITHLTVTSSLWRISSLEVYTDLDQIEINGSEGFFRSSFGDIGRQTKREFHHDLTQVEVENKMDLLWEDFNDDDVDDNEEDFDPGKTSVGSCDLEDYEFDKKNGLEDAAELGCEALKVAKTGSDGLVLSQKKHKMMLVLKVFMKKLFLLQKMARMKRKGT